MSDSGNLAEPVLGELDGDGRLIEADPLLLRLHFHCGGHEGGPLAIPQLASLCRLSAQLNMNLSRAVQAANDDHMVSMWVETRVGQGENGDKLTIRIVDWKEKPLEADDVLERARQRDLDRVRGRGTVRTDPALRIMAMTLPGDMATTSSGVGQVFFEVFEVAESELQLAVLELVEERQPLRHLELSIKGRDELRYLASGQPLVDRDGLFAGYRFTFERQKSAGKASPARDESNLLSNSLFGSQLGPALRQPLGKIIANAETIGSQLEGPLRGDYASYAQDIAAAGRHLMDLVDDLSDLEAIERPNFKVAVDDIDLVDLASRVGGLLAVKASDHQIRIDLPDQSTSVPAKGEFRRVLQILVNLVGNAIRYSPDGSVIKITARQEGEMAIISVRDQGDGIAANDHERIFEKFERLGRSGDGGSGLGLFISRRLAQAMGGDLTLKSKPGKGSTFELRLPAN